MKTKRTDSTCPVIAKSVFIVKAHGGAIAADSRELGGTAVTVTLPR